VDVTSTDFWVRTLGMAGIVVAAYLAILWIALIVWTWRDIRSRSDDPVVQLGSVSLVAVFFLPGLLLYMALRPPESLIEAYQRRLEAEAFLQELENKPSCPACQRAVEADFVACPYCRMTLRVACDDCGRPMSPAWVICAYCGAERVAPAAAPRAVATTAVRRDGRPIPAVQSAS
jgi:RNA polymerase subunit RPABC4/transcription elongation factor Spt4